MKPHVALIGFPGAGKTDLAQALMKREPLKWHIIDGYAEPISDDLNIAIGPYANYIGNSLIAAERLRQEVHHQKKDHAYVLCGTLIETATYASLHATLQTRRDDPEAQNRVQTFMPYLGMLMHDWAHWHAAYYLPTDSQFSTDLEDALRLYQVDYATLGDGSTEEHVDQILSDLSTLESALEATTPE